MAFVASQIRLRLVVPAIIATAYILFGLRVFGMYDVWIPGLSYLISLILLTTPRRSPIFGRGCFLRIEMHTGRMQIRRVWHEELA